MTSNCKKNLLQMVNGFGIGGAEKALLELVKRLDKDKYRVIVCSVGQGGPLEPEFKKFADQVAVFPKKFKFDITLIWKVTRLMQQENIDIIQTTLFYADVIGAFAARLTKVPVIISWQTALALPTGHLNDDKFRHTTSYKYAVRYVDKIIAVSEDIKSFFVEKRGIEADKIITIPYGVDLDLFARRDGVKKREELHLDPSDPVIGVVGHLSEVKGHTYLIEAAPKICKAFPNVKFVFAGNGPLRENLEVKVKNLNLCSNFLFLGVRRDIPELLNIMDIFVLPSLFEGLPNVILEAMASSKPVVASAVGGIPEAVQDQVTGLLVPSKNSDNLAAAILKLLKNREWATNMGKEGRKRVEAHFSIENEVKKIQCLYDNLFEIKAKETHKGGWIK